MKQLWAPWRLQYIQQADEQDGCIFCRALEADDETEDGRFTAAGGADERDKLAGTHDEVDVLQDLKRLVVDLIGFADVAEIERA